MTKERLSLRTVFLTSFVILSACFSASYSFGQGSLSFDCARFEQIPITPLISQQTQTVFETPGTIIVIHGSGVLTTPVLSVLHAATFKR